MINLYYEYIASQSYFQVSNKCDEAVRLVRVLAERSNERPGECSRSNARVAANSE